MNNPRKIVVFGFTPHRVKHIVAAMASLPAGLPAVLSKNEKPDTTKPALVAAQSNVASEKARERRSSQGPGPARDHRYAGVVRPRQKSLGQRRVNSPLRWTDCLEPFRSPSRRDCPQVPGVPANPSFHRPFRVPRSDRVCGATAGPDNACNRPPANRSRCSIEWLHPFFSGHKSCRPGRVSRSPWQGRWSDPLPRAGLRDGRAESSDLPYWVGRSGRKQSCPRWPT